MTWVLRRDTGGYVNWPGRKSSYVPRVQDARTYPTQAAAEADACGNETAVRV